MRYERARKRGEECGMRERRRGGSVVQESEEEIEGVWYKSEEGSESRVDERESM